MPEVKPVDPGRSDIAGRGGSGDDAEGVDGDALLDQLGDRLPTLPLYRVTR